MKKVTKTAPLPRELANWVANLAKERGDFATAELLGIGRPTVARAAAGFAVRQSVANLIRARHQELSAA